MLRTFQKEQDERRWQMELKNVSNDMFETINKELAIWKRVRLKGGERLIVFCLSIGCQ